MYVHKGKGDKRCFMFCAQDSIDYGFPAAVIINYMWYQLDVKRAGGKSIKDGRYWIYDSTTKLSKLFPMFSLATLKRALKLLRDEGVLICSNHNRWKNDRTLWYSMPEFTVSGAQDSDLLDDEELDENKQQLKMSQAAAQNEPSVPLTQNELNVSRKMSECTLTQNELNVSRKMSQPLPSINTSINPPTINTPNNSKVASAPDVVEFKFLSKISKIHHENVLRVLGHWSQVMGIRFNPNQNSDINRERASLIQDRLRESYTLDQCMEAIDRCSANEFNMAKDGRNKTLYNDIKYIFTPERMEKHLSQRTTRERLDNSPRQSAFARMEAKKLARKEIDVTPLEGQNERHNHMAIK